MIDPYRTLGLAPGAPVAEIKRAYRRLAKEHHPDSAGTAALPRFLAIQEAYEMLMRGRAGGAAPAGYRSGASPNPAWRADPARARATRDAWRRRGRAGASQRGGSADGTNARPGADAGPGRPGAQAQPGAGRSSGTGGGTQAHRQGWDGRRPGADDPRRGGDPRASGQSGSRRGTAGAASPGAGTGGARDRREHGPRRARPGSTSYDEAIHEPFEPDWAGGSWYGQSSGTYWTINPREYADPRKHGPEYLARARRAARQAAGEADDDWTSESESRRDANGDADPWPATGAAAGPRGAADTVAGPAGPADEASRPGGADSEWQARQAWATDGEPDGPGSTGPGRPPDRAGASDRGWTAARSSRWAWADERTGQGDTAAGDGGRESPSQGAAGHRSSLGDAAWSTRASPGGRIDHGDGPISLHELVARIRHAPAGPRGRLALALAGWPPIGMIVALAIGELSGCARYAASCASSSTVAGWIAVAQLGIVAALLLLTPLARIAAFGSLAILLAALPVVAFLTAAGATYDPEPGSAALLALLGLAWVVGIAVGWPRRSRRMET